MNATRWHDTPPMRLSREDGDDIKPRPCGGCGATKEQNACTECGQCVSCHCLCAPAIPSALERAA